MAFATFADFLARFLDLCKFFSSGIFSSHFRPLQVFQLVFTVLSWTFDGQQFVSVGILGFSRFFSWPLRLLQIFRLDFRTFASFSVQVFLVGILDLCRFLSWVLRFFHGLLMASSLFQLAFWDFQGFLVGL